MKRILIEYVRYVLESSGDKEITRIYKQITDHLSDIKKMSIPQMKNLKKSEDVYDFVKPPKGKKIFRGIRNLTKSDVVKLQTQETTDKTVDKSWSTSEEVAKRFATKQGWGADPDLIEDRFGVVVVGIYDPDNAIIDWSKLLDIEEITSHYVERWKETLESSIKDEKEVFVFDEVKIDKIKVYKN